MAVISLGFSCNRQSGARHESPAIPRLCGGRRRPRLHPRRGLGLLHHGRPGHAAASCRPWPGSAAATSCTPSSWWRAWRPSWPACRESWAGSPWPEPPTCCGWDRTIRSWRGATFTAAAAVGKSRAEPAPDLPPGHGDQRHQSQGPAVLRGARAAVRQRRGAAACAGAVRPAGPDVCAAGSHRLHLRGFAVAEAPAVPSGRSPQGDTGQRDHHGGPRSGTALRAAAPPHRRAWPSPGCVRSCAP